MPANLKGVLPDRATQVIDQLQTRLETLTSQFNALKAQPVLTKAQADAAYSPQVMAQALSLGGSNPLNVSGLLGSGTFSGTVVLAKITGGGSNGLITFENGSVKSVVNPT